MNTLPLIALFFVLAVLALGFISAYRRNSIRPVFLALGICFLGLFCTAASYVATDVFASRFIVRKDGAILGTNVTHTVTNSILSWQGSNTTSGIDASGFFTANGTRGVSTNIAATNAVGNKLNFSNGVLISVGP